MRIVRGFLLRWTAFAVLLAAWQAVATAVAHPFFPAPTEVAAAAGRMWFSGPVSDGLLTPQARDNLLTTVGRILGGWASRSSPGWSWAPRAGCPGR